MKLKRIHEIENEIQNRWVKSRINKGLVIIDSKRKKERAGKGRGWG